MKINFNNYSAQPIPTAKYICSGCHFIDYIKCPGVLIPQICRLKVLVKCEKLDIFEL